VEQQHDSVRKTVTYKLVPSPAQERALEAAVARCRALYNAGLQERKLAWEQLGVAVNFAMQSAHLPGLKKVRPDYRDLNAQVLQEVLHRLDKAFAAFFRRVQAGEQPGYPRLQGRNRSTSCTSPQVGEHASMGVLCWTAQSSAAPRSAVSPSAGIGPCVAPPRP
jgi:putative transposase